MSTTELLVIVIPILVSILGAFGAGLRWFAKKVVTPLVTSHLEFISKLHKSIEGQISINQQLAIMMDKLQTQTKQMYDDNSEEHKLILRKLAK